MIVDLAKTVLGLVTFVLVWGALPLWFWWFSSHISDYMAEYSQKRAQRYMVVGAAWLVLTIWMLWRFVLPDWWVEATPMLGSEG